MSLSPRLALIAFAATLTVQAQSHPHVLMISVDGMRPDYITHADEHHLKVPNFRRFMAEGTYADGVVGVVPTVTYPSHTTMITGVWPGQHGIYANTIFNPADPTSEQWYTNFKENKAETVWEAAKKAGLTTGSISWPVTVDAPCIDWLIAEYAQSENIGAKETKDSDRPAGLLNELNASVPADAGEDDRKTDWAIGVISKYKPNFMTVHIGVTDHMQHAHGPFSPEANAAVEAADALVGRMIEAERAVDPAATIVVVSDHGFVATNTAVNLPVLLVQNGLIQLKNPNAKGGHPKLVSWQAEVWDSGGTAAIMLHDPKDKALADKVYAILMKAQADPTLGISHIATPEEFVKAGGDPDVSFIVAFKPGFKAGLKYTGPVTTPSPGTGTHGYLPNLEPQVRSSFFVMGPQIAKHKDLGIVDMRQIAPTVAKLLGVSLPDAKQPALGVERK